MALGKGFLESMLEGFSALENISYRYIVGEYAFATSTSQQKRTK